MALVFNIEFRSVEIAQFLNEGRLALPPLVKSAVSPNGDFSRCSAVHMVCFAIIASIVVYLGDEFRAFDLAA